MRGFFFEPLLKEPKQLKESWFLWKSEIYETRNENLHCIFRFCILWKVIISKNWRLSSTREFEYQNRDASKYTAKNGSRDTDDPRNKSSFGRRDLKSHLHDFWTKVHKTSF